MLDARINEVYWALYEFRDGLAALISGPGVCAPQEVTIDCAQQTLRGVGSGFHYLDGLSQVLASTLSGVDADLLPAARDLIPLALEQYKLGKLEQASEVAPLYVREEISWKKISEQGKRQ